MKRNQKNKLIWSIMFTILVTIIGLVLIWPKRIQIGEAFSEANLRALSAVVVFSLLQMVIRAKTWHICLKSIDPIIPHSTTQAANAVGQLASLLVGPGGLFARIWTLKRWSNTEMNWFTLVAVDLPVFVIEAVIVSILLLIGVVASGIPFWIALICIAFTAFAFVTLLWIEKKFAHRSYSKAFSVLRKRAIVSVSVYSTAAAILGVGRIILILAAFSVDSSLMEAVIIYIMTGILGLIPAGQFFTQGLAQGSTSIVLGLTTVATGAAGGIALAGCVIITSIIYSLYIPIAWYRDGMLNHQNSLGGLSDFRWP